MEFKEGQQLVIGVTEFSSEEEATGVVLSLREMAKTDEHKKRSGTFCPVIHEECRMDCESFDPAVIIPKSRKVEGSEKDELYWVIGGHRCVSPLVRYRGTGGLF